MVSQQFKWLGKAEELEFEKKKFRGKLAGKAYKYSLNIDGLIRVRLLIFGMALFVFKPVLMNFLINEQLDMAFLIERIIFSLILIVAGLLFNRYRVLALILACIPMLLIVASYLISEYGVALRPALINFGVFVIMASGFYHNYRVKALRKELESSYLENQLIQDQSN